MNVDEQIELRLLGEGSRRRPQTAPIEWVEFRRAAVRLAEAEANTDAARTAAAAAAEAVMSMAERDDAVGIGEVLRPDPLVDSAVWTVACYQIGDCSPTTLQDFVNPVEAVSVLSHCSDRSHVAAELVASTDAGVRWTALVRTGEHVAFTLLTTRSDEDTALDARPEPARVAAVDHWAERLEAWRVPRAREVYSWDPAAEPVPEPARPTPASPSASVVPVANASDLQLGVVLGQILEAVRSVDARLAAGQQAADEATRRMEAMEHRLSQLEHLLPTRLVQVTRWWVDAPSRNAALSRHDAPSRNAAPAVPSLDTASSLDGASSRGATPARTVAPRALASYEGAALRVRHGLAQLVERHRPRPDDGGYPDR